MQKLRVLRNQVQYFQGGCFRATYIQELNRGSIKRYFSEALSWGLYIVKLQTAGL